MALKPSFAVLLRRYREAAGLSQEELAERAGLTPVSVRALERGRRRQPYPHTVQQLALALDLDDERRTALIAAVPSRGKSAEGAGPDLLEPTAPALPAPPTPLVGRKQELAAITQLLLQEPARLVTVTGPGGVGKTRLALEAAIAMEGQFGPSVWIDLTACCSPDDLVDVIARSLRLQEAEGQSQQEAVILALRDRRLLLVLDNFERFVPSAPRVAELLALAPRLSLLVTSRIPLRIRGEHEVQLEPLSLPDPGDERMEAVASSEAVALFLERARMVAPRLALTAENASTVAAICRRLDGLPLALELAAARLRNLSPVVLLDWLRSRMEVLVEGPRDLPRRQRTLRDTLRWSHDLLSPSEQSLFRRLSVFAGGCDREGAEAVCGEEGAGGAILQGLLSLIEKNVLVQAGAALGDEPRFAMLETIHEYAAERLAESGEREYVERRHTHYFLSLALTAAPHRLSPTRRMWLDRLEADDGNLRAALEWSVSRPAERETAHRLAGALGWYWGLRGRLGEGRDWVERALSAGDEGVSPQARAAALGSAAMLARNCGDYDAARRHGEDSLRLLREAGEETAGASLALAMVMAAQGESVGALELLSDSLAGYEAQGDQWAVAHTLRYLGDVRFLAGEIDQAHDLYADSLRRYDLLDDPWGKAIVVHALGRLAWVRGDLALAASRYEQSASLARSVADRGQLAWSLIALAAARLQQGDTGEARDALRESARLWRDMGNPVALGLSLAGIAAAEHADGRLGSAARLFGAAAVLARRGTSLHAVDRGLFDSRLKEVRAAMGDEEFDHEWKAGQAMTLEDAVTAALTP